MKINPSKKIFFIGGISILAFVVFDGTPYGYALTDKIFHKVYKVFIENRLFCIKAIEKYNDASLEYFIQGEMGKPSYNTQGIMERAPYNNDILKAAEERKEATERIYKFMCALNYNFLGR